LTQLVRLRDRLSLPGAACTVAGASCHAVSHQSPSLPTRRSSDLAPNCPAVQDLGSFHDSDAEPRQVVVAALLHSGHLGGFAAHQDRKSTRLNSSHVKTSYAVLCLTKKCLTAPSGWEWQGSTPCGS